LAGRRHGAATGAAGGFALINGVIDLPLTLYQTFVLEQRLASTR
jgi:hypothetical protein